MIVLAPCTDKSWWTETLKPACKGTQPTHDVNAHLNAIYLARSCHEQKISPPRQPSFHFGKNGRPLLWGAAACLIFHSAHKDLPALRLSRVSTCHL